VRCTARRPAPRSGDVITSIWSQRLVRKLESAVENNFGAAFTTPRLSHRRQFTRVNFHAPPVGSADRQDSLLVHGVRQPHEIDPRRIVHGVLASAYRAAPFKDPPSYVIWMDLTVELRVALSVQEEKRLEPAR
jgi:hypothetical protein